MDVVAALGGLTNITAGSLLAIGVVMILAGKLVPRSHLDDMRSERDAWKTAALESEKARRETETASWKAVHALSTVEQVLTALVPPKTEKGGDEHVEVPSTG
jgi:hypothetical protein